MDHQGVRTFFLSSGTVRASFDGAHCLGGGTDASVYLAEFKNEKVALKVYKKPTLVVSPSTASGHQNPVRSRREDESSTYESLKQKNVMCPFLLSPIEIFEIPEHDGNHMAVVTEYCESNLYSLLVGAEWIHFTPQHKRQIVIELLLAVKQLHEVGIMHRDLKPDNIMFKRHRGTGCLQVKLGDFGYSRQADDAREWTSGVGTATHMAPECLFNFAYGPVPYDFKADVFSLGIIVYACICRCECADMYARMCGSFGF